MLLQHVIRFNVLGNLDKFAKLAGPFGIPTEGLNKLEIVDEVDAAIDRPTDDLRVPRHLKVARFLCEHRWKIIDFRKSA